MSQQETVTIKIKGAEFKLLDPDSLELGEVEQLEDAFDQSIDEINMGRAKAFRYLIFFSARRADVDLSMEDLSAVKLTELDVSEPKQTNGAAAKRPPKKAAA